MQIVGYRSLRVTYVDYYLEFT